MSMIAPAAGKKMLSLISCHRKVHQMVQCSACDCKTIDLFNRPTYISIEINLLLLIFNPLVSSILNIGLYAKILL